MPIHKEDRIEKIKKLRELTSASIQLCKESLERTDYNLEEALKDLLTHSAAVISMKKQHRSTNLSRVFIHLSQSQGAMLTIQTETDFASRQEDFIKFGQALVERAVEKNISQLTQLKVDSLSYVQEQILKMGENIQLSDLMTIQGPILGSYIHAHNKGCIVSLDSGKAEDAKTLAIQIVGFEAKFIDTLEDDFVQQEIHKAVNLVNFTEEKFMQDLQERYVLVYQPFYKDQTRTVGSFMKENNLKINSFIAN